MTKRLHHLSLFILAVVMLSSDGLLLCVFAQQKSDVEQPKFALLIGITNYKSTSVNKIDGCENNVPLLAQTLTDSYGFKKENVKTLLNESAGKDAIINGFRSHLIDNARSARKMSKEAVVVYYFCGHGSQYKDQDGDENDLLDETFVAYDSRTGNVPDILDDEIDDLKAELRPLTTNTTLILESCHSGTGSRAGDDGLIDQEADPDKSKHPAYKRKFPATRDEDAATYTEIAASASFNVAKSESKEFCNCEKPYSLMTKALVEALNRANHSTTYRSLGREIASTVAVRSRQDPQVEGNRDTLLFGGAAKRVKPYIEIERLTDKAQAVIRAGTVHGLKVGSQVAIYSSASATNTGDKDWLSNGVVTDVRDFQASIKFDAAAKVEASSHVVLTSPVFGGGAVLVALDAPSSLKNTADDGLIAEIKQQLKAEQMLDNQMVSLVEPKAITPASIKTSGGAIRLRREKFSVAFPLRSRFLAHMPKATACKAENGVVTIENPAEVAPDKEVYFLDDGALGGTPLYGRFFLPEKTSAAEIARLIRNYALRTNLETLNNSASTLPSQIALTVNRIAGTEIVDNCREGRVERGLKTKPTAADFRTVTNGRIPIGSVFSFKVKNISGELRRKKDEFAAGEPLFVTAIYLLNNGDINVIYPKLGAKEALADGVERTFGGYIASAPAGAEHLIVIVSKAHVDFSFYESMTSIRQSDQSPLARLLSQSGAKSRDSATLIADEPDSWGVIRVDLNIDSVDKKVP